LLSFEIASFMLRIHNMSIFKKTLLSAMVFFLAVFIVIASLFLVGKTQRSQDIKALHSFVDSNSGLTALRQKQPIKDSAACSPNLKEYGKCPAIAYRISEEECLLLAKNLHAQKQSCNQAVVMTYNGRNILIQLGDSYGHSGLYATIVMNEKNLLWQLW
jgi:hypothetical protein